MAEALLLFCNEITERKQPCLQLDHCYITKRFVFVKGSIPGGVLELKRYPEKGKNCLGRYCTAFFILRAKCILKNMSCGVKNEERGLQSALILLRFLCDLQIPVLIKLQMFTSWTDLVRVTFWRIQIWSGHNLKYSFLSIF